MQVHIGQPVHTEISRVQKTENCCFCSCIDRVISLILRLFNALVSFSAKQHSLKGRASIETADLSEAPASSSVEVQIEREEDTDQKIWLQFFEKAEQLDRMPKPPAPLFNICQYDPDRFSVLLAAAKAEFKPPLEEGANLVDLQELLLEFNRVGQLSMGEARIFYFQVCHSNLLNPLYSCLAEAFYRRGDFKNALGISGNNDAFATKVVETCIVQSRWAEASLGIDAVSDEELKSQFLAPVFEGFIKENLTEAALGMIIHVLYPKMMQEVSVEMHQMCDQYLARIVDGYLRENTKGIKCLEKAEQVCNYISDTTLKNSCYGKIVDAYIQRDPQDVGLLKKAGAVCLNVYDKQPRRALYDKIDACYVEILKSYEIETTKAMVNQAEQIWPLVHNLELGLSHFKKVCTRYNVRMIT